jgi:hypothetical protein
MTSTEFIQKSKDFEKNLIRNCYNYVAEVAALQLVSEISNRVVMTQTKANGNKFSRYSRKPMYVSRDNEYLIKKQAMASRALHPTKTKKKDSKTVYYPGGYAELRRAAGEFNALKNFFFYGTMWRDFGITQRKLFKNGFKIRLAGKTELSQDKMDGHSKKNRTNILAASKEEEKELAANIDIWVQQQINKYFK